MQVADVKGLVPFHCCPRDDSGQLLEPLELGSNAWLVAKVEWEGWVAARGVADSWSLVVRVRLVCLSAATQPTVLPNHTPAAFPFHCRDRPDSWVPVAHLKLAARGPLRLLVEWLDHCSAIPEPGDVDVIAGGPPCQDVSVSGQQQQQQG